MIATRPFYCVARVTLEALSAHGIHSGQGDATHDVLLVRDANGLPALPGSSVAGVLRHRYRECYGADATGRLFGQLGAQAQPSWLNVGWGLVHDSNNQPHEGLLSDDELNDELLSLLKNSKPLVRQRVRLEHTGTAADSGKFDVTLIPAGVRYTAWLSFWCDDSDESREQWANLLALLGTGLRVGHGTRSGTGHFKVQHLATARWDLRTPEGRKSYSARPRLRRETHGLSVHSDHAASVSTGLQVELQLRAESGWRVGGGEFSLNQHKEKEPQLLPQHEYRVTWSAAGRATTEARSYLLAGSAIKGALRHRVAYHYRCLVGDFAHENSTPAPEHCPAVQQLFGHADDDQGVAGLLVFSDLVFDKQKDTQTHVLTHNRIDRFTGGVMNGALFGEEVLWQTPLSLRIGLLNPEKLAALASPIRQALQRTLDDLAQGWLPLGASGSRGLGVFSDPTGNGPQWSDQGQWINGTSSTEEHA